MKKINYLLSYIKILLSSLLKLEDIKVAIGRIEKRQEQGKYNIKQKLEDVEFKVFSQWGEDGIIQYIINRIDISNKYFIEFGVEDYLESNTRFLLINNNWSGTIIDGSKKNVDLVKKQSIYWRFELEAINSFITSENINELILSSKNYQKDIGLLSIDIDGNDYWVWKNIECINPIIVVIEYNSIFGFRHKVTIPYDANFYRTKRHYSNLYFGASLAALNDLAISKGYSLVGSNSSGCNAFFVRNDFKDSFMCLAPEEAFRVAKFRESRNKKNKLTYLNNDKALLMIKELPVVNLNNNEIVKIKDLYEI